MTEHFSAMSNSTVSLSIASCRLPLGQYSLRMIISISKGHMPKNCTIFAPRSRFICKLIFLSEMCFPLVKELMMTLTFLINCSCWRDGENLCASCRLCAQTCRSRNRTRFGALFRPLDLTTVLGFPNELLQDFCKHHPVRFR